MEPRYIYFKEIHLDTEKRFIIDLTKNNSIKKIKFSSRRNYFVTNLKVNAKIKTDVKKNETTTTKFINYLNSVVC